MEKLQDWRQIKPEEAQQQLLDIRAKRKAAHDKRKKKEEVDDSDEE